MADYNIIRDLTKGKFYSGGKIFIKFAYYESKVLPLMLEDVRKNIERLIFQI